MERKIIITIKRPTGVVEDVDVTSKFPTMFDAKFAKIKKATREAGKGECLSWREDVIQTAAEAAWEAVLAAEGKADHLQDSGRVGAALAARNEHRRLLEEWKAAYPVEAAKMESERLARIEARNQQIRDTPEFKAMIEGRD